MHFEKVLINNKNELLKYKSLIFELFYNCFNKLIENELWEWAYIANPNGSPVVSLYFHGDKLIGHYAVIPLKLALQGVEVNAALSMTTMVDKSYRKYGTFVSQANEVYEEVEKLGYQLVYGFPNKNSAPGFAKRLDWVIEKNMYVAKFNYETLIDLPIRNSYSKSITFNTNDEKNLSWRLSKPDQTYFKKGNNIIKKFDNGYDIVFSDIDYSALDKDKEYNLFLEHEMDKHIDKKVFDYMFGYRVFDQSIGEIEFKKDLILSDLF